MRTNLRLHTLSTHTVHHCVDLCLYGTYIVRRKPDELFLADLFQFTDPTLSTTTSTTTTTHPDSPSGPVTITKTTKRTFHHRSSKTIQRGLVPGTRRWKETTGPTRDHAPISLIQSWTSPEISMRRVAKTTSEETDGPKPWRAERNHSPMWKPQLWTADKVSNTWKPAGEGLLSMISLKSEGGGIRTKKSAGGNQSMKSQRRQ